MQLLSRRTCIASDFFVLVLSEAVLSPPRRTVLVLDGCLTCGVAARRSKRFAGTCGPRGRMAILECFEHEHEHEHEKQPKQNHAPKWPRRPRSILETTLAATRWWLPIAFSPPRLKPPRLKPPCVELPGSTSPPTSLIFDVALFFFIGSNSSEFGDRGWLPDQLGRGTEI